MPPPPSGAPLHLLRYFDEAGHN